MTTHEQTVQDLSAVLSAVPLVKRKALSSTIGRLSKVLGVEYEEVQDLFKDQRELRFGTFIYYIHGMLGSKWTGLSLADAAAVLQLKPEYLRTHLATLESRNRDKKYVWFEPRTRYWNEGLREWEKLTVRRYKDPASRGQVQEDRAEMAGA